jgi:glycosyltransferase involved in cell wall biosynthesis
VATHECHEHSLWRRSQRADQLQQSGTSGTLARRQRMAFQISSDELFIGITSWNSEVFLDPCLQQVAATTDGRARVVVLDNCSTDSSVDVARRHGAEVVVRPCNQAVALNALLAMSRSRYTLLIHSDVILLNPRWFELCRSLMTSDVALVAPEDIGCGPYTRVWGSNKPESSFMLFDTAKAKRARDIVWKQRFKIKYPAKSLDFGGDHVTYNLPGKFEERGLQWQMMQVHPSPEDSGLVYSPSFVPKYWRPSWEKLRYGLGNFYSISGETTHYHNWYDRAGANAAVEIDWRSTDQYPADGGVPKLWLQICSQNFLRDLQSGNLRTPPGHAFRDRDS